jgi:hypothetical protein
MATKKQAFQKLPPYMQRAIRRSEAEKVRVPTTRANYGRRQKDRRR